MNSTAEENMSQLRAELAKLRARNETLEKRNVVLEAEVSKYKMGFASSPKNDLNGTSPHRPDMRQRKSEPYFTDESSGGKDPLLTDPIPERAEANSSEEEFEMRAKRKMTSDNDTKNESVINDTAMPLNRRRVSVPALIPEDDAEVEQENYEEKREEPTPTPGSDHDFSKDAGLCGPGTPREDQEVSPHGPGGAPTRSPEVAVAPERREPQGICSDEDERKVQAPKEETAAPHLMVPRGDEDPEAQSANVSPTKSFGPIPHFPTSPTTGRQTPVSTGPQQTREDEKDPVVPEVDDEHEKRSPANKDPSSKKRLSLVVNQYSTSPPPSPSKAHKTVELQFPEIPVVPKAPALLNDEGPDAYGLDDANFGTQSTGAAAQMSLSSIAIDSRETSTPTDAKPPTLDPVSPSSPGFIRSPRNATNTESPSFKPSRVVTDDLDEKSKEKLDNWCDEIMVTCNLGLHDTEKINIFLSKNSSLLDLKKEVEKRHPKCAVDKQHVVMGGQEITENNESLESLGFNDGSTCIVVVSGMQSPRRVSPDIENSTAQRPKSLDSHLREAEHEAGETSPRPYSSNEDLDFATLKSNLAHVGADAQAEEYRKEAEEDYPVWRLAPADDLANRTESVNASEDSMDSQAGMWPAKGKPEDARTEREPGAESPIERNGDKRRGSLLDRQDNAPGEPRVDLFNPSPEPFAAKSESEPAQSMGSSMPISSGPSPHDAEEGLQEIEELGQEDPAENMEGPGGHVEDVEDLFPEAASPVLLQPPPGALRPSAPGDAMVVVEDDDDIEDLEGEPLVSPTDTLGRWGLSDKMLRVRRHINEAGQLYSQFVAMHEYDQEAGRLRFPEKPIGEIVEMFNKLVQMIKFDDRGYDTLPLYMIKKRTPTNREIDRLFIHNPESRLHRTLMENKTKPLQGTTVLVVGLGPAALLLGIQLAIAGATVEFISKEYAGGNAKVYSGLEVIPVLPELLEHLRSLGVADLLPYLNLDLETNPHPAIACAVLQHALIRIALVLGCRLYPTIEFVSMSNTGQIRCTTSTTGSRTVVRNMSKKYFNVIADSTGVVRDCRVNGQPVIGTKSKVKTRFHCGLLAQFGSCPGEMAVKEFPLKSIANARDCQLFDEKEVYLSHISYLRTPFSHYVSGVFSKDLSKYGLTKTSLTVAPNGFMASSEQHIVEGLGREIRKEWSLPREAEFDMLRPGQAVRAGGGADRSDKSKPRSKRKTKAVGVFHFKDTCKPKAYLRCPELKSKKRTMVLLVGDAAISSLWQIGNSSNHGCMSAIAGSDVLCSLLPKLKIKPHNAEDYIESARKQLALRIKGLETGRLLPKSEVYKRRPI